MPHLIARPSRADLIELSESYRKRLGQQGEIDRAAEDILTKLRQIREEIAAREYPGRKGDILVF